MSRDIILFILFFYHSTVLIQLKESKIKLSIRIRSNHELWRNSRGALFLFSSSKNVRNDITRPKKCCSKVMSLKRIIGFRYIASWDYEHFGSWLRLHFSLIWLIKWTSRIKLFFQVENIDIETLIWTFKFIQWQF